MELILEDSDSVDALNVPDIMCYAANVSDEDIGDGKPGGTYPFVIIPGPMDTSSDFSA